MSAQEPKKLFIKTYGCQMNVYDSERISESLAGAGYTAVDAPEDADLVLLNTCHIREKAAEKVYSELGRIRKMADAKAAEGGEMRVGVTGCVAQAEGAEIVRRQPLVDLVVGPQAYHRLPAMLDALKQGDGAQVVTDFPTEDKFEALPARATRTAPSAFLSVQEGCDKFCAFCVVPYTRGAEFSRPVEQILTEAKRLSASGVRELTLLGQNVNAYHGTGPDGATWSLARLIGAIAEIDGIARIRYTTSHPNDMSADLIAAHAEIEALMPYLHLPVQAGSDRVLKAMNRKHTAQSYLTLLDRIRAARPDIALSGDFIVGFPGETDEDFEQTLDLVDAVGYAQAFSFKYSPRPGTPAASAEQVPEAVKDERLARLQQKLRDHQTRFQEACVGRTMSVLFEKSGREDGQLVGRSPYLQPVHVMAPETMIRQIAPVRIESAHPNSLGGVLETALA